MFFFSEENEEGKWNKWRQERAESEGSGDELNDVMQKLKIV